MKITHTNLKILPLPARALHDPCGNVLPSRLPNPFTQIFSLMNRRIIHSIILGQLLAAGVCHAQTAAGDELGEAASAVDSWAAAQGGANAKLHERMVWWKDAKFGMFIHWGAYSKAGGEWKGETNHHEWLQFTAKIPLKEYTEFAKGFDPKDFDADEWVTVAKNAGMKYMIITSKHHDGIAMYDSQVSDHNIMKLAGLEKDPIRQLAEACRKQGIRFGVYYSLGRDWEYPDCPTGKYKAGWRSNLIDFPDEKNKDFSKYFERKVKPQVRELLTNYGPIDVMWFDTPELIEPSQSKELLEMIRSIQPNCIVNQRVGNDLGDYGTPEQTIPPEASSSPWETCMTLNGHWAYNKADHKWKSAGSLIRNLVDISSKGGNYLLNVGPTGEGVIPQPSVERLTEIGDWLKTNGESIYNCGPTPFGEELGSYSEGEKDSKGRPKFVAKKEWRATTQPGKLYIHVLTWPSGTLMLPVVKQKIAKAYLLADSEHTALELKQGADGVTISLPKQAPDPNVSVICLEFSN
ncbi:alpha-L-fucosidase [Ilumatobacter sp.]|uniref:alpha-L-fucosidase n=1 Tax=Ilumatobacter sp. TaxID=1967498 RepID=UPI003C376CEE